LSFIAEETAALLGLGQAARGIVLAIAGRSKQPETRATVDQDATIIESHKREAQWTYEPNTTTLDSPSRCLLEGPLLCVRKGDVEI
jgi:hypothetical protein